MLGNNFDRVCFIGSTFPLCKCYQNLFLNCVTETKLFKDTLFQMKCRAMLSAVSPFSSLTSKYLANLHLFLFAILNICTICMPVKIPNLVIDAHFQFIKIIIISPLQSIAGYWPRQTKAHVSCLLHPVNRFY